jgi:hypothetical protein
MAKRGHCGRWSENDYKAYKNGDFGPNERSCSCIYGVPSSDNESSSIDSAVDYVPKEKKN